MEQKQKLVSIFIELILVSTAQGLVLSENLRVEGECKGPAL